MAATSHFPTLSQLRASDYSYFGQLGGYLQQISPTAQNALEELAEDVRRPGGADWEGVAAEAAIAQAGSDVVKARPIMWSWDEVAASTQRWQEELEAGTRSALDAVDDAGRDGFEVGEDYSVTDTYEAETEEEYDERLEEAEAHAGLIGHRVTTLVGNESRINGELRAMSAGWGKLSFKEGGGPGGGPGDDPGEHGPTIVDPATDPVQENQSGSPFDLGATIPGTGIVITGDPKDGRPHLHIPGKFDGDNPFPVPEDSRALPTGTAVGPNGQQYAFYSVQRRVQGTDPKDYIAPESHVQNLADPAHDLGPLTGVPLGGGPKVGISQASGVYDPKTGRMMIVGNVGQDGQRALWQSDPIKPGDAPNAWMSSMHEVDAFHNLGPGDRENQIIALPKGGYLLTSASNGNPVVGVTGANPTDLLTASPHNLTPGNISSPNNLPAVPYGPTVTDVKVLPNGQEQVTMRMSTWPTPEGWQPGPNDHGPPYNPRTYTTTFDINP